MTTSLADFVADEGGAVGLAEARDELHALGHDWVDLPWLSEWFDSSDGPVVGRSRVITTDLARELEADVAACEVDDEDEDETT